jgi:hypothetical protein
MQSSTFQENIEYYSRCRRESTEVVQDLWPLGTHIPLPLSPNSTASRNASSHIATHKPKQRVTRAAHKQASMKAQPQNARSRYLTTISTMEKLSPASLECDSATETKFLWLLNAGDMAARARSGITLPESLPGTPVQVVELLAKVSRG